ncbi:hypothetical protein BDR05DRAFT_997457 [Suillus weaverae]|nr:hypothetical protein BDR05DRAFT_997457 [Suillus weaverae]
MSSTKRKYLSTILRVRKTRILDTGSSRTTIVSLTQVQRDCLAFKEEQRATNIQQVSARVKDNNAEFTQGSKEATGANATGETTYGIELTAKTRQLLAEAALKVGRASTGYPAVPSTDYGNWDHDNHHLNGADSDDGGETESNAQKCAVWGKSSDNICLTECTLTLGLARFSSSLFQVMSCPPKSPLAMNCLSLDTATFRTPKRLSSIQRHLLGPTDEVSCPTRPSPCVVYQGRLAAMTLL